MATVVKGRTAKEKKLDNLVTLTPLQSTQWTGFGVQATYTMLRAGKLPHIKVGNRFFIPKNALLKWMESTAAAGLVG